MLIGHGDHMTLEFERSDTKDVGGIADLVKMSTLTALQQSVV